MTETQPGGKAWAAPEEAFVSDEALRLKRELIDVGRKLWLRQNLMIAPNAA